MIAIQFFVLYDIWDDWHQLQHKFNHLQEVISAQPKIALRNASNKLNANESEIKFRAF